MRTVEDYRKNYRALLAYGGETRAQPSVEEAYNAARHLDGMYDALTYDDSA